MDPQDAPSHPELTDPSSADPSCTLPPNASEEQFRAWVREQGEASCRQEGNDNSVWTTAMSKLWTIDMRFAILEAPDPAMELDLHDLWHMFYHGSKHISPDSPASARLAFQLVRVQAMGPLIRVHKSTGEVKSAVTSDGLVWTDLPFFVADMTGFWVNDCAKMSADQRINFASFLAKIASVGLVKDKVSSIGLVLLRETLETPRPLGDLDANKNEDPSRSMSDLTVADLLPALNVWLNDTEKRVIHLCDQSWNDCPQDVAAIGPLYRDDASTRNKVPGFSAERWIFWLRRLEEITEQAKAAGKDKVAEMGVDMMNWMFIKLYQQPSSVRSAFEADPEVVKHRNEMCEQLLADMNEPGDGAE